MKLDHVLTENELNELGVQKPKSNPVQNLAKQNQIANPNLIRVGQKIKLPNGSTYTVAPGDTLSGIAAGQFKGQSGAAEPQSSVRTGPNPNIGPDTRKRAQATTSAPTPPNKVDAFTDFSTTGDAAKLAQSQQIIAGTKQAFKQQFGQDLQTNSEVRSRAKQQDLFTKAQSGQPGIFMPANPDKFPNAEYFHLFSMDISPRNLNAEQRRWLEQNGWSLKFGSRDPVHWQYVGGAGSQGLTEQELTELGVAGLARGAMAAGRGLAKGAGAIGRGAVKLGKGAADLGKRAATAYTTGRQTAVGRKHSSKIVQNLSNDFLQMVGGGTKPTLDNLKDFLISWGFEYLDQLQPSSSAQQSASPGSLFNQGDIKLRNREILDLLKQAVELNYSRIVAAQQGRTVSQPSQTPAAQSSSKSTPDNPFNDPAALNQAFKDYIKGGGQMNKGLNKLMSRMRKQTAPTPQSTPQPTPEGVYSKFLDRNL